MKATVISGSRNPDGQTARAVEALLEGLRSQGGEARQVFLPTKDLQRCRQCNEAGWGVCLSEGRCVIEDDFDGLVQALRASDAVVFATPVYFGDLSESLRAFLDRLRRITRHETGQEGLTGKCSVGICVAGGGGGGAPSCSVSLERVLATCGLDVVDMIPVRRQNLEMKLDLLQATGKWLAGCPSSHA